MQAVGTILANAENCDVPIDDSIGWNLETGTACELGGPGDLSSTGPGLRPLADNGGRPGPTRSPAGARRLTPTPSLAARGSISAPRCAPPGSAAIGSYERDAAFLPTPLRPTPQLEFVGGAADIELLPHFATALSEDGISLEPAGGAEGDGQGTGLAFVIGNGKLAGRHAGLELGGWLILRGPGPTLALSRPVAVLNGRRGFLAMREGLGGRRVRLVDLSGVKRDEPRGGQVSLVGEATLSAAGRASFAAPSKRGYPRARRWDGSRPTWRSSPRPRTPARSRSR